MDLLPGIGWLWRGLRGRSVTFAALFALAVLGFSVTRWLRYVLDRLEAPWLVWLLLPLIVIGLLAKKEVQWMPDAERRLKWAKGLIFGSLLAAILSSLLLPKPPEPERGPPVERPRRHGHPAR